MKSLHKLRDMMCKELDALANKQSMSSGTIDMAYKLTDIIKNIDKIEMLENGGYSQDGYSQGGEWEASGTFGHSYDEGNSYARGRYARRDSMGRYSRDSGYSEYSRSGGKEDMMNEMSMLMDNASNDRERQIIKRAMEELKNA